MKSKKYLWLMSLLSVGTIATTITAFSCSNSASSENSPENKPPVTPEEPTPPITPEEPKPPVTPEEPTPPITPEEPKPPVTEPEVPANPTKVTEVNDISKESNGNILKFKLEILGENLSLDASKYELHINNNINKWTIDSTLSNSNKVVLYTQDKKFENTKITLKVKGLNNEDIIFTKDISFGKFITTEDRMNELKTKLTNLINEKYEYVNNSGTAQSFLDAYAYFNENRNYNEGDIVVNHTVYLQNLSKPIKDNSYFVLNTNIKCEGLNISLETYKFINQEVVNEATNDVEYKTAEGIVFKNNEIIRYEGTSKEINITMSLIGTNKDGIKGKSKMITIIGDSVFSGKSINKITLSPSIKIIGKNAFSNNNITELTLPASLIELGKESFKDNKIKNISFQYVTELITISNSAFENNLIESISSWGNISEIGDHAFRNNKIYNTGLNLDKSNKITRIGIYAFAYNSIQLNIGGGQTQKIIKLPASLTHLGVGSFEVSQRIEYFGGADARYDFFELGDRGSNFFKNISVINTNGQIRKYVTLEYFNVRIVNNEHTWQDVDIDRPI